jgi:hypothetical protein
MIQINNLLGNRVFVYLNYTDHVVVIPVPTEADDHNPAFTGRTVYGISAAYVTNPRFGDVFSDFDTKQEYIFTSEGWKTWHRPRGMEA